MSRNKEIDKDSENIACQYIVPYKEKNLLARIQFKFHAKDVKKPKGYNNITQQKLMDCW